MHRKEITQMTTKEISNNYLKSLGLNKQIKTLTDITKLIKIHVQTFAFSSMKVLLKQEINLNLDDIHNDIVLRKRGGYCFEHNKLFYEVLKELGFDVQFYLARVINNMHNEVPQTHRFTLLNFENEKYLIDVGIGFRSPCVPVKFGNTITSSHLGISFSIKEFEDNSFGLQLLQNNEPFTVTHFDLNKCYEADFEMGHFYTHKHPQSSFLNNLIISTISSNTIFSLRNKNYLKIYRNHQETLIIEDEDEFSRILKDDFNCIFTAEEIKFVYEHYIKEIV